MLERTRIFFGRRLLRVGMWLCRFRRDKTVMFELGELTHSEIGEWVAEPTRKVQITTLGLPWEANASYRNKLESKGDS